MYNRYLITGATGFLGRAIVEELVRRNVRVDALVLHERPFPLQLLCFWHNRRLQVPEKTRNPL